MSGAKVVAVILNWNNLADTLECVEAVRGSVYSNLTVWVVDNASREDPSPVLRERYPDVHVIRNAENLGYAGGNNVALRLALAEGAAYVLLLNNDVVIAPDMPERLVRAADEDGRIGMLSPRVFYYDDPGKVYWDGGVIDWRSGDTPHESGSLARSESLILSEWLDGCALLARADTIQDIGLLDERYFLYYEDTEWTVRAARRGWRNAVVPEAHAWHKVSRTAGVLGQPARLFYFNRNRYLFLRARGPYHRGWRGAVRCAMRAYRDYRWARGKPEARRAVLQGYWDGVRGRGGAFRPAEHPWLLAAADRVLLGVTELARVVRRVASWRGNWRRASGGIAPTSVEEGP